MSDLPDSLDRVPTDSPLLRAYTRWKSLEEQKKRYDMDNEERSRQITELYQETVSLRQELRSTANRRQQTRLQKRLGEVGSMRIRLEADRSDLQRHLQRVEALNAEAHEQFEHKWKLYIEAKENSLNLELSDEERSQWYQRAMDLLRAE